MAEPRTTNRLNSVWRKQKLAEFNQRELIRLQCGGGGGGVCALCVGPREQSADSGRTDDIPDCLFGVSPLSLRLSITATPPPPPPPREARMTARTSRRWAEPLTGSLERAGRKTESVECERAGGRKRRLQQFLFWS